MRLELLQQDVGWDFKDDVGDEEDRERIVVLRASTWEFQFGREPVHGGIGNVGSVKESEQVEDAQHGDDSEIDLGKQFPLGGAGGDGQVVCFRVPLGIRVREVGVVVIVWIVVGIGIRRFCVFYASMLVSAHVAVEK